MWKVYGRVSSASFLASHSVHSALSGAVLPLLLFACLHWERHRGHGEREETRKYDCLWCDFQTISINNWFFPILIDSMIHSLIYCLNESILYSSMYVSLISSPILWIILIFSPIILLLLLFSRSVLFPLLPSIHWPISFYSSNRFMLFSYLSFNLFSLHKHEDPKDILQAVIVHLEHAWEWSHRFDDILYASIAHPAWCTERAIGIVYEQS